MATEIDMPMPIFRLQAGEFRVQLIGGHPQGWARVAYMTSDGTTVGDTTYSAWSPETWEIVRSLCDSIETDLAKAMASDRFHQWVTREEDETISYTNKKEWEGV